MEGVDGSVLSCLFSIALHKSEVNIISSLNKDPNKKIKIYDIFYHKKTGFRRFYHAKLGFVTSKNKNWTNTGIVVYSIDGQNWMTDAYATRAFAAIQGNVWDAYEWGNQIIPIPTVGSPFGSDWPNIKTTLQTIINQANALPVGNPSNKGYRLLDMEIRDYIYQANLDKLTFEMAFRLPFFMEKRNETPYTQNSLENFNNPYYTKFDEWFEYANTLRTNSKLQKLNEAGQIEYDNNYRDYDLKYYTPLIKIERNPILTKYNTPAYMAQNYYFENKFNYDKKKNKIEGYNNLAHIPDASSGITLGFGFDLQFRTKINQVTEYTEWQNLSDSDKEAISNAIGQNGKNAKQCKNNSFWTNHTIDFEIAVRNTPKFIQDYIKEAINLLAINHLTTDPITKLKEKDIDLYLRIFQSNFKYFYNDGINQFLNEIEKIFLLSQSWNTGNGSLNQDRQPKKDKNGKILIDYASRAKRAIHSFNTHDLRYLKYTVLNSGIKHNSLILDILNRYETYKYFQNEK